MVDPVQKVVATTIVISRAPHGYQVALDPNREGGRFGHFFEDLEHARSYARGLRLGAGWTLDDRTTGKVIVEQLNSSQWHASFPTGRGSGVTNYVDALAYALIVAAPDGWAVETVTLDGERMIMAGPSSDGGVW